MNYESGGSKRKENTSFLEKLVDGILIEFAFWIIAGLLLLAFYGGVIGIIIALISGGFLALIFWAERPSKNSPQPPESKD
jgi:hypothetical protein